MSNLRIIDNEKTIGDLFNNLSKHDKIPGSVQSPTIKEFIMMKFSEGKLLPYLTFRETISEIGPEGKFEVSFFYKETFISFETKIENIENDCYYITMPKTICTSFKRTKTRYKVKKEDNVFISVYGSSNRYQVIDISTNGLSFEADRELFDEEQSIKNIMLVLGGTTSVYVDGIVKYVSAIGDSYYRFGIKFLSIEWMFYQKIFNFIFEKSYSDIKLLKDYSYDDISSLYNESRYIRLKNSIAGRDLMENMLKLEKLKNKTMISLNLIQQRDGNIEAVSSAVRNYNHSFYIQEILSISNDEIENVQRTDMYAGIADSMLGHPYFEHLIMHINDDVQWHLEMMRVMIEIINDEDKVAIQSSYVYKCNVNTNYPSTTVKAINNNNPNRFLEYCSQMVSELERSTFCYKENTFWLNELKEIYQSLGYFISRKYYEMKRGDELIAYAIAEAVSPEVDIDRYMNKVTLFMINREFDIVKITDALLKEAAMFYSSFGIQEFSLLCKDKINSEKIEYKDSIHRVLMSRDGVIEFLYFLKANLI